MNSRFMRASLRAELMPWETRFGSHQFTLRTGITQKDIDNRNEHEYPNINTITSISFFKNLYNFNPLPYIVNIGDADGNFMIDVSDASDVLTLYAKLATTEGLTPTAEQLEHCDVDSDGQITALDASHILTYYAFISTGGEGSFKDFINKYVLTSAK